MKCKIYFTKINKMQIHVIAGLFFYVIAGLEVDSW